MAPVNKHLQMDPCDPSFTFESELKNMPRVGHSIYASLSAIDLSFVTEIWHWKWPIINLMKYDCASEGHIKTTG